MNAKPNPVTALIVIDVQRAFDIWDAAGERRNQPDAMPRIAALLAYDRVGPDGELHRADDIHAMTLANLHEEFARIVTTAEVIAALR
jgi:hypothetical protein